MTQSFWEKKLTFIKSWVWETSISGETGFRQSFKVDCFVICNKNYSGKFLMLLGRQKRGIKNLIYKYFFSDNHSYCEFN